MVGWLPPRARLGFAAAGRAEPLQATRRRGVAGLSEDGRGPAVVEAAGPAWRAGSRDRLRPGGSCQALLHRGLLVAGIDPAAMHPTLLAHPRFVHIRKRAADVRRRDFRQVRWLVADMNVAPTFTLDAAEAIVGHRQVNIRGLLLTLKLLDWKLAEQVPDYLARVRSWGFPYVRARQLQFNRQEICVAAFRRKPAPRKSTFQG